MVYANKIPKPQPPPVVCFKEIDYTNTNQTQRFIPFSVLFRSVANVEFPGIVWYTVMYLN